MLDLAKLQKQPIPESYYQKSVIQLEEMIRSAKKKLGRNLIILAHHYQCDEVVKFADQIGDSLELARKISQDQTAHLIVFCGVRFMAETADILSKENQAVFLPETTAGCPMADMATVAQVNLAVNKLKRLTGKEILPITYVNSSAEVKAVVGRFGGLTVTSGNASKIMSRAFENDKLVLFLPDQYLGINTAHQLGVSRKLIGQWDSTCGELEAVVAFERLKLVVWDGYCSVHQQFNTTQIKHFRELFPEIKIIVHPECREDVVLQADESGSTAKIINYVHNLPKRSRVAIGTDNNLVARLKKELEDQGIFVHYLNQMACSCQNMNRIDLPHLAWILSELESGQRVNQIKVPEDVAHDAKLALNRMLAIK